MTKNIIIDNSLIGILSSGNLALEYQLAFDNFCKEANILVTPYSFLEAVGINLANLPKPIIQSDINIKNHIAFYKLITQEAYRFYSESPELRQEILIGRVEEQFNYINKGAVSQWLYQCFMSSCQDKSFIDSIHYSLSERYALACVCRRLSRYKDALELLVYCVSNYLNKKGYDCFLLIYRLYTLVANTNEVSFEQKKKLSPINEFKKYQDLMDGEIIQMLLLGVRDEQNRSAVTLYTSEEKALINERLYMARGAYSLALKFINEVAGNEKFKFYPGKVELVSRLDPNLCFDLIDVENIQNWAKEINIPSQTIELNRWSLLISDWAKQYPFIKSVHFFGSRVKGTYTDTSDLDIAVEVEGAPNDDSNALATWMFESKGLKEEISKILPFEIDLQFYDPTNTNSIIANAISEASILVYYKL